MKRLRFIILITLGLCLMSQTGWAKKAYVTDSFKISLRRGPSIEKKILEFLPSGMPVEILESKEGWNLVQPLESEQSKTKGWVLSRYLITRLPWENQAKSLIEENDMLKEKLSRIEKEWDETLKRKIGDYSEMKEFHDTTQETIQTLTKENESLRSSRRNFIQGALVLFCGLIIGLIFGRQQKRRRSSLYF